MSSGKHENYATLNLIGYGLAKFDQSFVKCFGFSSKHDFFQHIVAIGVAETPGVVKNRQDLFDPFFDNKRKGWWQKGDAYIHRKHFIDSLFGELPVEEFSAMVKYHLQTQFAGDEAPAISPILRSKYRQIQQTGKEAERYFMHHFAALACFKGGEIEDARLFGDGFDFQIQVESRYYLAEVKGLRAASGGIRMTANEFQTAQQHGDDYALVVVSSLYDIPRINAIFNPAGRLQFTERSRTVEEISFHSQHINWQEDDSHEFYRS